MQRPALVAALTLTACLQKVPRGLQATTNDLAATTTITASTDGALSDLANAPLVDLAANNGPKRAVYVAVGYEARHLTSFDGTSWSHDTFLPASAGDDIYSVVAVGNGAIIIAGDPGVYRSTDGVTFTAQSIANVHMSHEACGTYAHGQFVLVSNQYSYTSLDGITWQQATANQNVGHCKGLAYGNGTYLAIGDGGGTKRSVDGLTWTDFAATSIATFDSFTFGAGVFLGVGGTAGDGGTVGFSRTSADGLTWSNAAYVPTRYSTQLQGVAYGNGLFSTSDAAEAWYSTDGKAWAHDGGTAKNGTHYGALVFFENQFVSASGNTILQSTDGKSYAQVANDTFDGAAGPGLGSIGAGYIN